MISEQSWKEGFSTRVKEKLNELDMQQKELAGLIFVSPVSVQKYCKGDAMPSGYTLSLIAAALNCSVSYLVGEEEQ